MHSCPLQTAQVSRFWVNVSLHGARTVWLSMMTVVTVVTVVPKCDDSCSFNHRTGRHPLSAMPSHRLTRSRPTQSSCRNIASRPTLQHLRAAQTAGGAEWLDCGRDGEPVIRDPATACCFMWPTLMDQQHFRGSCSSPPTSSLPPRDVDGVWSDGDVFKITVPCIGCAGPSPSGKSVQKANYATLCKLRYRAMAINQEIEFSNWN